MTKKKATQTTTVLAVAASLAGVANLQAQSSEALIDKLVQKGILTVKEANDLREETDKNFNQAYAQKSGMPEWVSALKFNGDFRTRFEGFYSPNSDFVERDRFRYRARFGVTASLFDDLEVGLRLTSSEAAKGFSEGDPISGNTTFGKNGSKKLVYIDLAYGKWSPLHTADFDGSLTVGKMENPFVTSDMVFDQDYTPEGIGVQAAYHITSKQDLKFNAGGFILNEIAVSQNDPYLLGAQVRWDAAWTKKLASTFGLGGYTVLAEQSLYNGAVPNMNAGNTRHLVATPDHKTDLAPSYNFNPFVLDGYATYTLDRFPLYKGAFPIKVGGEYMNNPAAPSSADNYGYNVGVTFGKAGKRGTWELAYNYKYLGANAWYEEFVDSDFGAYYPVNPPNAGMSGPGYYSGTNVKGHILKASYSPLNPLTLSVKWFYTDLIDSYASTKDTHMNRLQVDASLKF